MKVLILSVLILALSGCNATNQAVRFDVQGSTLADTSNNIDSEKAMPSGRISLQYQDQQDPTPNQFRGVVSQIGLSFGQVSQTTEVLEDIGAVDFDMQQVQLDLGVRYYGETSTRLLQPFLGVGFAPTWTEFNDGADRESDITFGVYGELGVETALGDNGRMGLGYRYTLQSASEIMDLDTSALMFSIGWSF